MCSASCKVVGEPGHWLLLGEIEVQRFRKWEGTRGGEENVETKQGWIQLIEFASWNFSAAYKLFSNSVLNMIAAFFFQNLPSCYLIFMWSPLTCLFLRWPPSGCRVACCWSLPSITICRSSEESRLSPPALAWGVTGWDGLWHVSAINMVTEASQGSRAGQRSTISLKF